MFKLDGGNGGMGRIPLRIILFGITLMTAPPALLYSFNASLPKLKNIKKMMEDTGIVHQNNNVSLWDRGLIDIQR